MTKLFLILFLVIFSWGCYSQSRYISITTKKIVFSRDGGKCQCCGSYSELEYDHIIPFSCGGSSVPSNIQLLCFKCNRSKSNSCYCKVHNTKVGNNCCNENTTKNTTRPDRQNQNIAVQCSGTTKKGTRCKNRTTNANGRCHLH